MIVRIVGISLSAIKNFIHLVSSELLQKKNLANLRLFIIDFFKF